MAKEKVAKVVLHGNGVTQRGKTCIGTKIETRTHTCPPMILTSPYATIVGLHHTAQINARLAGNCKVFVTLHMKHVASSNVNTNIGFFFAVAGTSDFKLSSPKNTKHAFFLAGFPATTSARNT